MRGIRLVAALAVLLVWGAPPADAASYVPITGSGSTWSQIALDQWSRDVKQNGITVNYSGSGSSAGRSDFKQGLTDFGISEIPFQAHPEDGSASELPVKGGNFSYLPIVAGGTSFMYHLTRNGKRVTNLRLSGETVAKIFTGAITKWNDPAITKDMNGVQMPAEKITPVLRSDGSGTTAQFTLWMSKQYPSIWQGFSHKTGLTSYYPSFSGAKSQNGSNGVAGYVSASYGEGAITYVEYGYATNAGYPVVKLENKAGYFVQPTPSNVAIALLKASINSDLTQNLDAVYTGTDKRTYPLSSYSYMIVPRDKVYSPFNTDKGRTLSTFINYFLCSGQQKAAQLGYSPLPKNLVLAAYDQVAHIPGHIALPDRDTSFLSSCNNPTFSGGVNTLVQNATNPPDCDKAGNAPCGEPGTAATGASASASPGATTGAGAAAGTPGAPGAVTSSTGGTAGQAFAEPVTVGSDSGFSPAFGYTAVGLLVAVLVVPPVLTAALRRRREDA